MDLKNTEKQAAGKAAADLIQPGMVIGIGTGSTAAFFIESLIHRCKQGLHISAVATSQRSYEQAAQGGIHMVDINTLTSLDLAVDGADEIDSRKQMIKGGGGALLREKIVASMAKEMIVIVDSSKVVDYLGAFPLPIEITPFAHQVTMYHLQQKGYQGVLRKDKNQQNYRTDNGNYIVDVKLKYPCQDPKKDEKIIREIPGVVETGFFLHLAGRVIIGLPNGEIEIRS